MRSDRLWKIAGILIVALLASAAVVAASLDGFALRWRVVAGGGGRSASAGYVLHGSAGQPAAGVLSSTSYRLGAGFWYGVTGAVAQDTPTATRSLPAPTRTASATATRTLAVRSRVWLPVTIMK